MTIVLGLSAVIVAVGEDGPGVLTTRAGQAARPGAAAAALPFGAFDPAGDRTLELSLRRWVREQTGFDIGYVEQLYTFGDRGREAPLPDAAHADRVISVGYLALTPERAALDQPGAAWDDWYRFFPYEAWRGGRPALIDAEIAPRLRVWAGADGARTTRVRLAFALDGAPWNEERALERYELLYEACLIPEALRDRARYGGEAAPEPAAGDAPAFGDAMTSDHRRILATAMSRLRGKLKYRPIVFELMPERFTLLHLQRVVEAISGLELHKQNFRRLLDRTGLVEGAGIFETRTGGRPAELFRFRREALTERPVGGVHVPTPRT
jgi:hypothetical protein